jgi:hypothetical protein
MCNYLKFASRDHSLLSVSHPTPNKIVVRTTIFIKCGVVLKALTKETQQTTHQCNQKVIGSSKIIIIG